jgi:opacity protein-like surface antigen
MRFTVSKVIPMLMVSLACCPFASAQFSPSLANGKYEFTVFGGVSFGDDFQFSTLVFNNGAVTSQTVGMRYASGYQIGFRGTENLGDHWAVHLEYSFANQPLLFTNLSPTVPSISLGQNVSRLSYDGSYLLLPPSKRFRPYVKAGAGTALFFIKGHSIEDARALGINLRDSWEFLFDWGGGLNSRVDDQVALSFEFKNQISGFPSYGLPRNAQIQGSQFIPGISRNGFFHNWQVNFGITYIWDD